mgnify:CR=1 FL=1
MALVLVLKYFLIFFLFYYNNDKNLIIAIPPLIVATIISVLLVWILEKKIPMVPLLSGIPVSYTHLTLPTNREV